MNDRTGEIAADVAWSRPAAIPAALILGYNGAARADRAQVDAWGRPFLMGFESATTRSYAGGDAGEADAAFSCRSFDEVGYPLECGSWVCAADSSSTPGQFLANIEEYGYRYALRMIAGGRTGPITAYGNPDAVEAMCRGIRRAGLLAIRWGVGTWGYGEGRGANQPPNEADAELVQSGNTPGPAEGTDHNWLYADVATFAAWGGPAPAPPDLSWLVAEEDDMQQYAVVSGSTPDTPLFQVWNEAGAVRVKRAIPSGADRLVVADLTIGLAKAKSFDPVTQKFVPFVIDQDVMDGIAEYQEPKLMMGELIQGAPLLTGSDVEAIVRRELDSTSWASTVAGRV